jgi:hypothetical protein
MSCQSVNFAALLAFIAEPSSVSCTEFVLSRLYAHIKIIGVSTQAEVVPQKRTARAAFGSESLSALC